MDKLIIMSAEKVLPLQKLDTVLNADAVEWCPYIGLENILLCGTYQLQESKQSEETASVEVISAVPQVRVGRITVYQLIFEDNSNPQLQECGKVDMSGVLDIKWPSTKLDNKATFGVVDAEGLFQMFQLEEGNYSAKSVAKRQLSESSLGLSLGWAHSFEETRAMVAASDSLGSVTVLDIRNDVSIVSSWKAHDYEAWITAFQNFDNNIVYTGGDDCKLKGWDLRDISQPTFCCKRHQMGVCSIQSHPFNSHIFASGSYDEQLLIWDQRNMKQFLCSAPLGGGIWRIKWNPFNGNSILTATMYNGVHIVDYSDMDMNSLPITASYDDHNLAYGADWCRLPQQGSMSKCGTTISTVQSDKAPDFPEESKYESYLISTCSFYDHSLHLWEWRKQIK